jgi:hypothetical protein
MDSKKQEQVDSTRRGPFGGSCGKNVGLAEEESKGKHRFYLANMEFPVISPVPGISWL